MQVRETRTRQKSRPSRWLKDQLLLAADSDQQDGIAARKVSQNLLSPSASGSKRQSAVVAHLRSEAQSPEKHPNVLKFPDWI